MTQPETSATGDEGVAPAGSSTWKRVNGLARPYLIAMGALLAIFSVVNPGDVASWLGLVGVLAAILGILPDSQRTKLLQSVNWRILRPLVAAGATLLVALSVISYVRNTSDVDVRSQITPHHNQAITTADTAQFDVHVPAARDHLTGVFDVSDSDSGAHGYCQPVVRLTVVTYFGSSQSDPQENTPGQPLTLDVPTGAGQFSLAVRYRAGQLTDCTEDVLVRSAFLHD